jgi:hypothetical protein
LLLAGAVWLLLAGAVSLLPVIATSLLLAAAVSLLLMAAVSLFLVVAASLLFSALAANAWERAVCRVRTFSTVWAHFARATPGWSGPLSVGATGFVVSTTEFAVSTGLVVSAAKFAFATGLVASAIDFAFATGLVVSAPVFAVTAGLVASAPVFAVAIGLIVSIAGFVVSATALAVSTTGIVVSTMEAIVSTNVFSVDVLSLPNTRRRSVSPHCGHFKVRCSYPDTGIVSSGATCSTRISAPHAKHLIWHAHFPPEASIVPRVREVSSGCGDDIRVCEQRR